MARTKQEVSSMTRDKSEDSSDRRAIRAQIDENLKLVYSAALNEQLPDRFRELLDQLKAKDVNGKDSA
jgi:Anti-sigma factor NepR